MLVRGRGRHGFCVARWCPGLTAALSHLTSTVTIFSIFFSFPLAGREDEASLSRVCHGAFSEVVSSASAGSRSFPVAIAGGTRCGDVPPRWGCWPDQKHSRTRGCGRWVPPSARRTPSLGKAPKEKTGLPKAALYMKYMFHYRNAGRIKT